MLSCTRFSTCRAAFARKKTKTAGDPHPAFRDWQLFGSGSLTASPRSARAALLRSCILSRPGSCFLVRSAGPRLPSVLFCSYHSSSFSSFSSSCTKSLNLNEQNPEWTIPKWTKPWIVQNREWTKSGIGEWNPELDKISNKQNHESGQSPE